MEHDGVGAKPLGDGADLEAAAEEQPAVRGLEGTQAAIRVLVAADRRRARRVDLLERLAELLAARVAQLGIALEAACDQAREPRIEIGDGLLQRRSGALANRPRELAGIDAGERGSAGHQLVEHGAERVDVRAPRWRAPGPHLGRHVVRRADHRALVVIAALVHHAGEPEVDELRDAVLGHHRVLGLEIAVHDTAPVRGGETTSELDREPERVRPRHRPRVVAQRLAADELADDVRPIAELAHAIDADDVRVLDARGGAGLHQEPLASLEVRIDASDELDRDRAGEDGVLGEIHLTHLTATELLHDQVVVELLRWIESLHDAPSSVAPDRPGGESAPAR